MNSKPWIASKRGQKTWAVGQSGGPTQLEVRTVLGVTDDPMERALMEAMLAGLNAAEEAGTLREVYEQMLRDA